MAKIIISGDDQSPQWVRNHEAIGDIRRIMYKVYTDDLDSSPEEWTWKMRFQLIERLIPGAILSHRTAFNPLGLDKVIIITWDKPPKKMEWPGLIISCEQGPKAIESDVKVMGIFMSGQERRLLENLQPARASKKLGNIKKVVEQEEIEKELRQVLSNQGEYELNKLRDRCKKFSIHLKMTEEAEKLDVMISALLNTGNDENLRSPISKSFSKGLPYDERRVSLLMELSLYLQSHKSLFPPIPKNNQGDPGSIFAFYESYFSNYIEGTTFEVEEAERIIFQGKSIPLRIEDSHDVQGTFDLVNDSFDKSFIPISVDEFLDTLRKRHKKLMSARKNIRPGQFKAINNRAGNSIFVEHQLTEGTLRKGFEIYHSMDPGFIRAAFMMFFISEVHPFEDGNGRISRIMMNADLDNSGESRIIIPTSMRGDYLRNLKALTQSGRMEGFPKMLRRAQIFSSNIPTKEKDEALYYLQQLNAFEEED